MSRAPAEPVALPSPLRRLMLATIFNTTGHGLLVTISVLYFVQVVGLSAAQVGGGLTLAGLFGLFVGVPAGRLADRLGPRDVLVVLLAGQAATTLTYTVVGSFPVFLLAACLVVTSTQASNAVRQGLIAGLLPPEARVSGRARLRVITNIGIGVGSGIGALALASDIKWVYLASIGLVGVLVATAAVLVKLLPHVPPTPPMTPQHRLGVLGDRPYVTVVVLSATLSLQYGILEVGVPLWIAATAGHPTVVAVLLVMNTVMVVLLQVRVGRRVVDVGSAARASRRSAAYFAASCALLAATVQLGDAVAVVVLLASCAVLTFGELLQAAGEWGLSFGLAPEYAQGQYQGLASTGSALATMAAPAVMALVVQAGSAGWLALGVLFVLAGVATVPAARWAEGRMPMEATS